MIMGDFMKRYATVFVSCLVGGLALAGCSGQADHSAADSGGAAEKAERSSADSAADSGGAWEAERAERSSANASLSAALHPDPAQHADGAYDYCIEQITNRLKAPATAQFSKRNPAREAFDGYRYLITGTVDSENSFGALLRSDWGCEIVWTGSSFVADKATVYTP